MFSRDSGTCDESHEALGSVAVLTVIAVALLVLGLFLGILLVLCCRSRTTREQCPGKVAAGTLRDGSPLPGWLESLRTQTGAHPCQLDLHPGCNKPGGGAELSVYTLQVGEEGEEATHTFV